MSNPQGVDLEQAKILKANYQRFFATNDGKAVLADLMRKCYENESEFHEIPTVHAYRSGQRSIFVHIKRMAELDIDKLKSVRQP